MSLSLSRNGLRRTCFPHSIRRQPPPGHRQEGRGNRARRQNRGHSPFRHSQGIYQRKGQQAWERIPGRAAPPGQARVRAMHLRKDFQGPREAERHVPGRRGAQDLSGLMLRRPRRAGRAAGRLDGAKRAPQQELHHPQAGPQGKACQAPLPSRCRHRPLSPAGGRAADRKASPDPLPALAYGLLHQRGPEIRRSPLKPGRRHLPAGTQHQLSASCKEGTTSPRGSDTSILETSGRGFRSLRREIMSDGVSSRNSLKHILNVTWE